MKLEFANDDVRGDNIGYLNRIHQIQDLAIARLLDGEAHMLPEVAEICEDIANLYLNIADEIRSGVINRKTVV